MILNYRVELCRKCYFKRTHKCTVSDSYTRNTSFQLAKPGGECPNYKPVPWLPQL